MSKFSADNHRGPFDVRCSPGRGIATVVVLVALAVLLTPPRVVLRAQPPAAKVIHQDFRNRKALSDEWKIIPPKHDAWTKPEDGGLRIMLPKTFKSDQPVGVRLKFPVSGDFEITGAYQILSVDKPSSGPGVGIAFNLVDQNNYKKFARFGRFLSAQEGNTYVVECRLKDSPNDNNGKSEPTESRSGQLKMIREGSMLRYLVADEPANVFREIHHGEFTADDLEIVRFAVCTNSSPAGMDVLLVDLKIRIGATGQPNAPVPPPKQEANPRARSWLAAALFFGFAVTTLLAIAVGVVIYLRRRRAAGTTVDEP